MQIIDLDQTNLRQANAQLQSQSTGANQTEWQILNPKGAHAIAVGLDAPINVTVEGSTG